jgi:hypothetical protein
VERPVRVPRWNGATATLSASPATARNPSAEPSIGLVTAGVAHPVGGAPDRALGVHCHKSRSPEGTSDRFVILRRGDAEGGTVGAAE